MTGSNLPQGPNELVFLRTSPRAPILLGPLELGLWRKQHDD